MKRLGFIALIALVLVGCNLSAPTETPTSTPSQDVTVEPLPTDTPIPPTGVTPLPTETPDATATVTPEPVYTDRLQNGDFEGGFDNQWYDPYVPYGVADNWLPVVWRDFENPRPCADGQTQGCNPVFTTRTPEYKPSNNPNVGDPFRTLSGNGQQWFCAGENCFAGISQTVQTVTGEQCIISAWAQIWGSITNRSNVSNEEYRSDYATQDDRDNMHLLVVVNPAGDGISFPFPDSYLVQDFGYADGLYDEPDGGAVVGFPFVAEGETTTVAFVGYQLFPVGNANWYVDAASVSCNGVAAAPVVDLTQTPTPIATSEVPVTVEAQGIDNLVDNQENDHMDTQVLLDILFVLLAGGVAFPLGSGLGNLVSAIVDLVKAVLHIFDVELNEEWGGRAFSIATLVVFAVAFYLLGANPLVTDLPDNVEMIVNLSVNVLLAVSGLLGAFNFGDLIHKALKVKAPLWFSIKERAAIKAAQGNG
jgi:uncharacterized membrane protein YqjE